MSGNWQKFVNCYYQLFNEIIQLCYTLMHMGTAFCANDIIMKERLNSGGQ